MNARISKANGTINQIMFILEDIYFGRYFFQVAIILCNSMFINSILFNSEAWNSISYNDLNELEKADKKLLRRILECPESNPKEMIYLELACLPIGFIIMARRTMFLQYIVKQDSDSWIHRVFQAQMNKPTNQDWCQVAKEIIRELGLNLTLDRIKVMKEEDLKENVKKACEKKALEFLNKKKEGHSNVLHLSHPKWEQQPYLKPNQMLSIDEAKFIFLLRTRMLDIKPTIETSIVMLFVQSANQLMMSKLTY